MKTKQGRTYKKKDYFDNPESHRKANEMLRNLERRCLITRSELERMLHPEETRLQHFYRTASPGDVLTINDLIELKDKTYSCYTCINRLNNCECKCTGYTDPTVKPSGWESKDESI